MFNPHPDLPKEIVKWFDTTLRGPTAPVVAAKRVANAAATAANGGFLAALDEPNGVPAARRMFDEARAQGRLPAGFDEAIVNQLGYERLNDKDAAGAVEILKMNVEAFPKSANAYDSLGDAYEAAGQLEPARENAQKCLALLSDDAQVPEAQRQAIRENAERKLQPGTNQQ
jgi:tetratricopeptide (TPR) repeat protein